MSNACGPSNTILCCKCAEEDGLKAAHLCSRHPDSEGEKSSTLVQKLKHYLYDESISGDSICLIQLEPEGNDVSLRCSLVVRPLNSDTSYTALSYTWGDPATIHTISCNGQRLLVGENLHSALLQFRRDGRTEPLWVDAVCINQKNNAEKTQQVRRMQQIYEIASLVVCWLGEEEKSDEEGFSRMRKLFAQCGEQSPQDFVNYSFNTVKQLGLPDLSSSQWGAMCRILYRPYFSRIWIFQEIIAATGCIIQCGTHTIDRTIVLTIGSIYERFHQVGGAIAANIPLPQPTEPETDFEDTVVLFSVQHLWAAKALFDFGKKAKICQLLMNTRVFEATEPRDRFYALIGLSSDVSSTFIDYDRPYAEVQVEIAKRCMMQPESWGPMIFSYVDQGHHSDSLPSWVPDWTPGGPIMLPLAGSYYPYKLEPLPQPNWQMRLNNQIALNGRLFDKIATVIHETPYTTPLPKLNKLNKFVNYCKKMEEWEDSCWELAMRLREYPTGEGIFEAYWRALIFNRQNLEEEPSQNFEWAYKSWNTAFSTGKDESLLELTSIIQQPGNNQDPSPATILEMIQRLSGLMYTGMQFIIAYGKLSFKFGLLNKLLSVAVPFENAFFRYAPGRKFCITKTGFMGWVPSTAQENDLFCFFDDCSLPFVLRRCEGGYKLIGDSYLHGLMNDPLIVLLEKKQDVVLL